MRMNSKVNYLLLALSDIAVKFHNCVIATFIQLRKIFKRFKIFLLFFLKVARNLRVYILINNTHMQLNFIKNIQFTRLVKADGRLREFNFRKFNGGEGELLFSIDVVDDRGNRILFRMRKEDNAWKILPGQYPAWVMLNENSFNDLIEEEMREAS